MRQYPFYTALSQCSELYGLDLDEDTFETYAMSAWHKIGNKDFKLYKAKLSPKRDTECSWYVQMPCNGYQVDAITLDCEDFRTTDPIFDNVGMVTSAIENSIEQSKFMPNALYAPGKLVKYREVGDRIYFTEPFDHVNVLYRGVYADEDGLPYLNMKEVDAIAAYCAYADDFKKARLTKDQNTLALMQLSEARWKKLCNAARIPEALSQNSLNEILDASVSWDRKSYGRDYKLIR